MNEYAPRTVSPPGETLRDVMAERGLSVRVVAAACGMRARDLEAMLAGRCSVVGADGEAVAVWLGIPRAFLRQRQADYDRAQDGAEGGDR